MAGGHSRRFGAEDKLLAKLDGQSLGQKIATRFAGWDWAQMRAVARPPLADAYQALGYHIVEPASENGLGDNLALGAQDLSAKALLILLADMPFISEAHVRAMLDAAHSTDAIVCTRTGEVRSPPVLFGRDHFADLRGLSGDTGAKVLFTGPGPIDVEVSADMTFDVDTPADLNRLG